MLSGYRMERKEVGAPGEFDQFDDDELERAVADRLDALGLTPNAGGDTRHDKLAISVGSIALKGGDHGT